MDDEIDNLIIGMQEMLLKCEAEENLSVSEQVGLILSKLR